MNRSQPEEPTTCRRCGTCCRKGGPTLHEADRELVGKGHLPLRLLVTIRKGETAREPKSGHLMRIEEEMIKIKGAGNGWTCILFDETGNRCTDYGHRPSECRAMACWDTTEIEKIMKSPRLNRRDLLSGIEGLWQLIEDHERRCGLGVMDEYRSAIGRGETKAATRLMEMLRYDKAIRDLLVEKGTDPAHLDFLLGRPMERLLEGFGLRLERKDGRVRPVPVPVPPMEGGLPHAGEDIGR